MTSPIFALNLVASRIVLLAIPLSAIVILHVGQKVREESGRETHARVLEAISVVVAVGLSWLSCLLPGAVLCLAAVLLRSRLIGPSGSTLVDSRVLSLVVYAWSSLAIFGVLRVAGA